MDAVHLAKVLGISDCRVISKAREIQRVLQAKRRGCPFPKHGELCAGAVCLELAASICGTHIDVKALISRSGATEKGYRDSRLALMRLLGLAHMVTPQHLAQRAGCGQLASAVQALYDAFRPRFLAALSGGERQHADLTRPAVQLAALALVAKQHNEKIQLQELLDAYCVADRDFKAVRKSMEDCCADLLASHRGTKGHKQGSSRSKRKEREDDADLADELLYKEAY